MNISKCKKLLRVEHVYFNKLSKEERLEILRVSYYRVMREHHPDINTNKESSEAMSKAINNAYEELCKFYGENYNPDISEEEYEANARAEAGYEDSQTNYGKYHNPEGNWDKFWAEYLRMQQNSETTNEEWRAIYEEMRRIEMMDRYRQRFERSKTFRGRVVNFFQDVDEKIEDFYNYVEENRGKIFLTILALGTVGGLAYLKYIYDAGPNNMPYSISFNEEMEIDAKTERLVEMYYDFIMENVDLSQLGGSHLAYWDLLQIDYNKKIEILEEMHIAMQKEFETGHVSYNITSSQEEFNKILNNWIDTVNAKESYSERVVPLLEEEEFDFHKSMYQLIQAHLEEYYKMNIGVLKIGSLADNLLLEKYSKYDYNLASFLALVQSFKFDKILYEDTSQERNLSFNALYSKENYIKLHSYMHEYLGNEDVINGIRSIEEDLLDYVRPDAYHQIKDLGIRRPVRDVEKSFYYEGLMDAESISYKISRENGLAGGIRYIDIKNENFDYIFKDMDRVYFHDYVDSLEEKQNQIDYLKKFGGLGSKAQEGIAEILSEINIDIIYNAERLKKIDDAARWPTEKTRGLDVAYQFIENNIYDLDEELVKKYGLQSVLDHINMMREYAESNSPNSSFEFNIEEILRKSVIDVKEKENEEITKINKENAM